MQLGDDCNRVVSRYGRSMMRAAGIAACGGAVLLCLSKDWAVLTPAGAHGGLGAEFFRSFMFVSTWIVGTACVHLLASLIFSALTAPRSPPSALPSSPHDAKVETNNSVIATRVKEDGELDYCFGVRSGDASGVEGLPLAVGVKLEEAAHSTEPALSPVVLSRESGASQSVCGCGEEECGLAGAKGESATTASTSPVSGTPKAAPRFARPEAPAQSPSQWEPSLAQQQPRWPLRQPRQAPRPSYFPRPEGRFFDRDAGPRAQFWRGGAGDARRSFGGPDGWSASVTRWEAPLAPPAAADSAERLLSTPLPGILSFFLNMREDARAVHLRGFYNTVLTRAHLLPAAMAADLLRVPVKLGAPDSAVTTALCRRLLQRGPGELSSVQVALSCWALAKTPRGNAPAALLADVVSSMAAEAEAQLASFQPLSLANLLWAFGKLRRRDLAPLVRSLAAAASAQLQHFNPQNVANAYWALGTLELEVSALTPEPGSPAARELAAAVRSKLSEFNSQAIANLVWACARLGWREPELLQCLAAEASRKVNTFKTQETANLMWGFGKLGFAPATPTLRLFAEHAGANLAAYNGQEVANVYWALGTLDIKGTALTPSGRRAWDGGPADNGPADGGQADGGPAAAVPSFPPSDPAAFSPVLNVLRQKIYQFNAQGVANFVWAAGKMQWRGGCEALLPAIRASVARNAADFRPQNTANVIWALAKLRLGAETELCETLSRTAAAQVADFNTQELANTFWALSTLGWSRTALTPRTPAAAERIERVVVANAAAFRPQEVASLLWSCAKLDWDEAFGRRLALRLLAPPQAEKGFGRSAAGLLQRLVPRLKGQEAVNCLWAIAKLDLQDGSSHGEGVGAGPAVVAEAVRALAARISAAESHELRPQHLANAVWAAAKLDLGQADGVAPFWADAALAAELAAKVTRLAAAWPEADVAALLWAAESLRMPWLAGVLRRYSGHGIQAAGLSE